MQMVLIFKPCYYCLIAGLAAGQMYTYPARCWRKKRRLHQQLDPQLRLCELRLGEIMIAANCVISLKLRFWF